MNVFLDNRIVAPSISRQFLDDVFRQILMLTHEAVIEIVRDVELVAGRSWDVVRP